MIIPIVILSILLFLLILLFSPIKIHFLASERSAEAKICFLFIFKKRLYPLPKAKKPKKSARKSKAEAKKPTANQQRKKKGAFASLYELRSLLASILIRMPQTFSLKIKRFTVRVATDDAAKTALAYGAITSSFSFLLEWIDRHLFTCKRSRRDLIRIYADFESDRLEADIDLSLHTSLYRLGVIAVTLLLPHFIKRRKNRKNKNRNAKESGYVRSEKQAQRAD